MQEKEIKQGDVVVLNSGGPDMTVQEIKNKSNRIILTCSWFRDLDENLDYGQFPLACVTLKKCPDCSSPNRDYSTPKGGLSEV